MTQYVTDMKFALKSLQSSVLKPSEGDVIIRFIKGLKDDVKSYVLDNAPPDWWSSSASLFQKALQNAQNHAPQTVVSPGHPSNRSGHPGKLFSRKLSSMPRAAQQQSEALQTSTDAVYALAAAPLNCLLLLGLLVSGPYKTSVRPIPSAICAIGLPVVVLARCAFPMRDRRHLNRGSCLSIHGVRLLLHLCLLLSCTSH